MNVLKHDDADCTYGGWGFNWTWAQYGLIFQQQEWQMPFPGQRLQLILNDEVIWEKEGQHTPDEVWEELTYVLLMHDIICEPLTPTRCDVIALPSMEMP